MTNHYALIFDTTVNIGDTIPNTDTDDNPTPVVTDPRTFEIADILDARDMRDDITFVLTTTALRVARVIPVGEVRPHQDIYMDGTEIAHGIMLEADGGWRVEAFEPTHTILGPAGKRIVEIAAVLENAADNEDSRFIQYQNTFEADFDVNMKSFDTAIKALKQSGADGYWWENCAGSDEFGFEAVALGARDLIGTVEGWDQKAYDLLAAPYRVAFGEPLHPDDALVPAPAV